VILFIHNTCKILMNETHRNFMSFITLFGQKILKKHLKFKTSKVIGVLIHKKFDAARKMAISKYVMKKMSVCISSRQSNEQIICID
jgi:hypothetical protein